jgi:hypothetical protein
MRLEDLTKEALVKGILSDRLVKEDLVKFDGTPLFPERRAYTVEYQLSDLEAVLYQKVTDYVRKEFNRADVLDDRGRKGTIGFALTILQRRLASSPEAIYQSLLRRRERLQQRLKEEEISKRGMDAAIDLGYVSNIPNYDDFSDLDEDTPSDELEAIEEEIVDRASTARTIE